jgi:hypothetical protein
MRRQDVEPVYQPRHVSGPQLAELVNLYHLARTALSGRDDSRYQRLLWAAREFHKENPAISETAAYKDLSNALSQ